MCSVLHLSSDFPNRTVRNIDLGSVERSVAGMSYSICRIAKIKASGVTGIQIHDRREKDGVSHTNEDIDWTKTRENVDLLEQQERFRTVVSNRIAELNLTKQPRSDATVMAQCLVTSDNAFFQKMNQTEQSEYFKKSLDFLEKRYGKQNMVSAVIHYDERTPHMHVNFVPVTSDGRLSARDLFSPKELRKLQDDYNKFVRENGYDLERGELHSQKEHLSVEEYKVATRYEELKQKQVELDRVEQIDKQADLKAEKGKIGYSTKEVQAIKDQNKSLKVESQNKSRQIKDLTNTINNLEKRLKSLQTELQKANLPLERLNDLENEKQALQDYLKASPTAQKSLEVYEKRNEQAYYLGDKLESLKKRYHELGMEREKGINLTNQNQKKADQCDKAIIDLQDRHKNIEDAVSKSKSFKSDLEQATGLFKGKLRKGLQENLTQSENVLKRLTDDLKRDYGILPIQIKEKIYALQNEKSGLMDECDKSKEYTAKVEQAREQTARDYKYLSALANTQGNPYRAISFRRDARADLPAHEKKELWTSREDRTWLLERMEKENPTCLENIKDFWNKSDQQEREKDFTKQQFQSIGMDKSR